MIKMRLLIPALAALLVLPFGCTREPLAPASSGDGNVRVSLALSVSGAQQGGTKMADAITQHSMTPESFRGIDRVFMLPFKTGNNSIPVAAGDKLWDYRVALPQLGLDGVFMNEADANGGLIYNNYAHLYDRVYLKPETDAVLVYGKAPDASVNNTDAGSVAYLQHNGSLVVPDLDRAESTDDIVFYPDPISSNDKTSPKYGAIPWRDDLIANYLNKILQANVSPKGGTPKYYFNNPASYSNHPDLLAALEAFTNKGIYFPLSASELGARLTTLYRAIYPYATDASRSADYYYVPKNGAAFPYVYELAKAVLKLIYDDTKTADQNKYTTRSGSGTGATIKMKINGPAIFGLPAGTYPIQWQEGAGTFKNLFNIDSQGHFNGLGYIPSDEFCYPPSLWYYVNSPLVSTGEEDIEQKYTSAYSWDDIRSHYLDPGVSANARSSVVRDPIQYGVSLLELKIQQASTTKVGGKETLKDFAGANIDVGNTKFPLTGIVIADQYPQRFDFTPLPSTDDRAQMYYLYDADVNNDNGSARAWLSKTTASAALTTLVLPTRPGADVRFALEFLNQSNSTIITGANGCQIPPGYHFYLAGILKFSERTDNSGQSLGSVFVRDYVTEVKATFTSLKAAYDIIPDLTEPQLQLGVQAEFGWNLSTPTTVPVIIE